MRKTIVRWLSLGVALCLLAACAGCQSAPTKIAGIRHAGNAIVVEGESNAPYEIKKLGAKSTGNRFYLEDYVYDANGTKYSITNKNGQTVGSVTLSPVSYNEENTLRVDLATMSDASFGIGQDARRVEFYSSTGATKKLFILVLPRETSLEIVFNNVNIVSEAGVPILFNCSEADISIKAVGNSSLVATQGTLSAQDYTKYQEFKDYADEVLREYKAEVGVLWIHALLTKVGVISTGTLRVMIPIGSVPVAYCVCAYVVVRAAVKLHEGGIKGLTADAYQMIESLSNSLLELTQKTYNLLMSTPGTDGTNGADAIISPGGVSISADSPEAYLTICGAAGTNGTNAQQMLNAAYGGRGGNGGRGIVCTTYINVMPSSRCHITGGSGGSGGKGAKNLIGDDNTNRDGKSGQQGVAVDALHKYSE